MLSLPYINIHELDYTWILIDNAATYISWPDARDFCRNEYNSNLSSYHNYSDIYSHETMVINKGWNNMTCWLGLVCLYVIELYNLLLVVQDSY